MHVRFLANPVDLPCEMILQQPMYNSDNVHCLLSSLLFCPSPCSHINSFLCPPTCPWMLCCVIVFLHSAHRQVHALAVFSRNALYKSTFYLLFLLTYTAMAQFNMLIFVPSIFMQAVKPYTDISVLKNSR